MKNQIRTSLVETNIGPIEVKSSVQFSWFSLLTIGFFKKILLEIGGPAFQRDQELRKKWLNSLFLSRYLSQEESLERKQTICTTKSLDYCHQLFVKYAQRLALRINYYHEMMQLYSQFEEALKNDDLERLNQIYQQIQEKRQQQIN